LHILFVGEDGFTDESWQGRNGMIKKNNFVPKRDKTTQQIRGRSDLNQTKFTARSIGDSNEERAERLTPRVRKNHSIVFRESIANQEDEDPS